MPSKKPRRLPEQTTLYTGSRRPENRTFQKCLPSPLESIKNESIQTTGHESVQTSRLSANTECFPSPLESIKTNCNWRRKRPNHWPRKRPNQPPALQQTTIYTGPRRPENRTFQKCIPSPLESIKNKCNWPGKRPNHWPGKRPNQPP